MKKSHRGCLPYGEMINYNSYYDELFSKWILKGNVKVQSFDNSLYIKLDDLKTSLYNGLRSNANSAQIKPIPETSGILMDSFELANDYNNNLTIKVQENEPFWSVNFKRALGSMIFIDLQAVIDKKPEVLERTIYGQCIVRYEYENENDKLVVHKIIDEKNCTELQRKQDLYNIKFNELNKDFDQITIDTIYSYTVEDLNGERILTKIEALSNITYKSMPDDAFLHQIEQRQILKLLNATVQTKEILDVSKNTQTKDIIYEYGPDELYDFRWYPIHIRYLNKTQEDLAESFMKDYDELDKSFQIQSNLSNYKWDDPDTVNELCKYLVNMNYEGLTILKDKIHERNDTNLEHIFLELIPYIGSNHSTKLVKEIIVNQSFIKLSMQQVVKMLSILPTHHKLPSEEILKELEEFTNLEIDLVPKRLLQSSPILTFASLVEKSKSKNLLSQEQFDKYRDLYHEKYQTREDYEGRMIYLLGLINMGQHLNPDFITKIITNLTESNHIRSLAAYAFKEYLVSDSEKLYETFWPIVQNKSESFDVRVASLDLLLSSELSKDHFNVISKFYETPQSDPEEQHLSNYFVTTLVSIRNITKYYDPLGSLATEALKNKDFPKYLPAWVTGNYRFSYTDSTPNLGKSFQTRLVAEPSSNTINLIKINYNSFALTRNLGSYSVYLKLDGVLNNLAFPRMQSRNNDNPIDVLVELLKKNNFQSKENKKIHAELVLFKNDKAVFAVHTDGEEIFTRLFKFFIGDLEELFTNSIHIDFPVMDYTGLPTSFGTELWILIDGQDIHRHEMDFQINYSGRSQSYFLTWFTNYIPFLNEGISSFKKISSESITNIVLEKTKPEDLLFIMENNKSTNYTSVTDHIAASIVDAKEYCPSCKVTYEVPLDTQKTFPGILEEFTGIEYNTVRQYRSNDVINSNIVKGQAVFNDFFSARAQLMLDYLHYLDDSKYFLGALERSRTATDPEANGFFKILLQVLSSNNYFNRGPFVDNYMNISISFLNQNENNSVTNNFVNFTTSFLKKSEPEIKYNELVEIDFGKLKNRTSICFDREIVFPNISVDPLILSPPDPTSGKIRYTYNANLQENDSGCKTDFIVIPERFSNSVAKSEEITKSKQYKICKEQSMKHKFIPPTPECISVHNLLSKYYKYKSFGDLETIVNGTEMNVIMNRIVRVNDYMFQLILPNNYYDTQFEIEKYYINSNVIAGFFDRLVGDPTSVAYNNIDMGLGLTSSCILTPDTVSKFSGKILNNYAAESNNNVALVECLGAPQYGLTFKKINNKFIEFTLQANNNTIFVTNDDKKIKISLNEERINKNYNNSEENIMINYLSEDVVYISAKMFNVYYNTEYIFIKSWSLYQNKICGLCSDD